MAERRMTEVSGRRVLLIDSAGQVLPEDAGLIVVTGSHGGTSAAHYARAVRAALYVFNDAGIGRDEAGVAGLAILDADGIAACAVSHKSARIGDAADTLENGVVTRANALAAAAGFVPGITLSTAIGHTTIGH